MAKRKMREGMIESKREGRDGEFEKERGGGGSLN